MKLIKQIFLVVIILFPFTGKACREPIEMHDLFFKSDLIVKAKIVSHTDHYYKIQILDIYRDHQIGIKVGDYIKIKKEMNVESSADRVLLGHIEKRLIGVAFLSKSDRGWGIRAFPFFYGGKVTIRFDYEYCEIMGTSNEVKTQIREYFKEFEMINEKLIGKKTADEVVKSNLHQLALTQYVQLYRFTIDEGVYNKISCGFDEIVEVEEPSSKAEYPSNQILFEKSVYGLLFTMIKINGKEVKAMIDFGDPNVVQLSSTFVKNESIKVSKSNAIAQDLFGNTFEINEGILNEVIGLPI